MSSMERDERGSRPVPDPTVLTTQQLYREIEATREMAETLIDGLREILDEKFSSIDRQLQLVEQQRVEQKQDTKAAVDAALTAQKEAVKEQTTASERAIAKSEASTTKQLEQLATTFNTANKALDDKYDDLRDRITSTEAVKQGGRETVSGLYAAAGLIVAVLSIVIIAASFIITH
jgi:hypothetical protein